MIKLWEEFYPDVQPEVLGCPDPVLDTALRRAAQRFMQDTEVWRVWLDDVTTTGLTELDIELENNAELVRLVRATLDGQRIAVYAANQLPDGWKSGNGCFATGVCTVDRKTIQLLPVQAAGKTLQMEATLRPSNSAVGILDFLFDHYVAAIAMGAKAQVMAQPGQSYSNAQMAATYAQLFQAEVDRTAHQVWRGFSSVAQRVRASFF